MDGELTFCLRIPAQGGEAESEPVTVICDRYNARLLLDDGEELVFDRDELRKALVVRGEQAA
jgi:hypothetical protein